MTVNRTSWLIDEVAPSLVAPMIRASHYLHSMPAVVPCSLSLMVDGWVAGALVWAIPPRETSLRYGGLCWELARLWLRDELPRNSESWFIARAVRHVRLSHPEVKVLVSYADPAAGHVGTIYKASNWTYEGLTDSERRTPRFDYIANGQRVGRASHASGQQVKKVRRQPKHRYFLRLRPRP